MAKFKEKDLKHVATVGKPQISPFLQTLIADLFQDSPIFETLIQIDNSRAKLKVESSNGKENKQKRLKFMSIEVR